MPSSTASVCIEELEWSIGSMSPHKSQKEGFAKPSLEAGVQEPRTACSVNPGETPVVRTGCNTVGNASAWSSARGKVSTCGIHPYVRGLAQDRCGAAACPGSNESVSMDDVSAHAGDEACTASKNKSNSNENANSGNSRRTTGTSIRQLPGCSSENPRDGGKESGVCDNRRHIDALPHTKHDKSQAIASNFCDDAGRHARQRGTYAALQRRGGISGPTELFGGGKDTSRTPKKRQTHCAVPKRLPSGDFVIGGTELVPDKSRCRDEDDD